MQNRTKEKRFTFDIAFGVNVSPWQRVVRAASSMEWLSRRLAVYGGSYEYEAEFELENRREPPGHGTWGQVMAAALAA